MNRLSAKTTAHRLVEICVRKGIRYAIISPGSRNAPLTISLGEHEQIECLNIPDERVAAFFAIGMAQQLQAPVLLCCTSGSAGLNYAPALVEAYYQKIPLLVLTADRPPEWIDQRAGQTMRQAGMFSNYVKSNYNLVCDPHDEQGLWFNDRIVNQAIDESIYNSPGPVHINVPFQEPLYNYEAGSEVVVPKIIHSIQRNNQVKTADQLNIIKEWSGYAKVLVIVGQHIGSSDFDNALLQLSQLPHVVVLTETTSNVCVDGVFRSIDRLIDSMDTAEYDQFSPELILSCGGPIVSKKLRFMLRAMQIKGHWHVDQDDQYIDTYRALTLNIPMRLEELVGLIVETIVPGVDGGWKAGWEKREEDTFALHQQYLASCKWSDLQVMDTLHKSIPSGIWHAANSTPVRYTQLFETRLDLVYRSNRGVSGIDGCSSTAAGAAYIADEIVTIVTGDIAFFYDSNAFWHNHVSSNLRVFMLNNQGGSIFRYVKGPMGTEQFEEHFEAHHVTSAKGIAESYKISYREVNDENDLVIAINEVYHEDFDEAVIVEINTPRDLNIQMLKNYFKFIKDGLDNGS